MIEECRNTIASLKPQKKAIAIKELEKRICMLKIEVERRVQDPDHSYRKLKNILLRGRLSVIILMLIAGTAWGSETTQIPVLGPQTSTLTDISKVSKISVKVIISSPEKFTLKNIKIPAGSSPVEALMAVTDIKQGLVCADSREVQCIHGTCWDPYKNKWWALRVNGNEQNSSPAGTKLYDGDVVEWVFVDRSWHTDLKEWLIKTSNGD